MNLNNHHAHLIEGDSEETILLVCGEIEKQLGMPTVGNPDVWQKHTDAFGVEESRELRNFALLKPVGSHKCCIVSFRTASTEAQNALLKVLEDPTPNTSFFIITNSKEAILPTLQSRLSFWGGSGSTSKKSEITPDVFLSTDRSSRLDLLSNIVKEKDAAEALVFLSGIEEGLYNLFEENRTDVELLTALQEVARARKFLRGRSPSVKLILEHVALVLPRINIETKGKVLV